MASRLIDLYRQEGVKKLIKEFGYKNVMEVPRLEKIVINMGVGEAVNDKKLIKLAVDDLAKIAGQQPVVTKARKSVAGFKIREGWPIGTKVTLRRENMYQFLDKLVNFAIPLIRDFRGLSPNSFDGRGNYSFGVKDQLIFPELEFDDVEVVRGMDITIATTAKTNAEAKFLLKLFNFPFRDK